MAPEIPSDARLHTHTEKESKRKRERERERECVRERDYVKTHSHMQVGFIH